MTTLINLPPAFVVYILKGFVSTRFQNVHVFQKVGDTKPKKQAEKENTGSLSVRTPILLGKGGDVRVTILAKPGARLSAITGLSEVNFGSVNLCPWLIALVDK